MALTSSLQSPSPTQLAKDTIQDVRKFILMRFTTVLIESNRERLN